MKFRAWVEGHGTSAAPVEADAADEAAELAAEREYENSGGEVPSSHSFDVTVIAPDGTITRHDVIIEWDPVFSSADHDEEPTTAVIEALREEVCCG